MHEHYEYRRIRIAPRTWTRVTEHVRGPGRKAVEAAGGVLFGLWTGQIGLGANEGVIVSAWPGEDAMRDHGAKSVAGLDDLVESSAERLVATVRPKAPEPPAARGIYAHRFFDLQEADWPEFLELSNGAWPGFEEAFDVEIIGFWRSLDVEAPLARVLLMTRYASLATWEESRTPPRDQRGDGGFGGRFIRRHRLTDATVVVTTRLIATD